MLSLIEMNCWAAEFPPIQMFERQSQTTNGFYAVLEWFDSERLPAGQEFYLRFRKTDASVTPLYHLIPTEPYFIDVRLEDDKGVPVNRTKRGKEFGKHFDLADVYNPKLIRRNTRGYLRSTPAGGGEMNVPPITDLFELSKPGVYWLNLRAQVYTYETKQKLVRFEWVRIPVEYSGE
jgi:hypothetical protein